MGSNVQVDAVFGDVAGAVAEGGVDGFSDFVVRCFGVDVDSPVSPLAALEGTGKGVRLVVDGSGLSVRVCVTVGAGGGVGVPSCS